jgi:hypothetical protein
VIAHRVTRVAANEAVRAQDPRRRYRSGRYMPLVAIA